jgi:putative phosphoribosyl transferase
MLRRPGRFLDRADAGRRLGRRLLEELGRGGADLLVVGLPRGGVVVAGEVAKILAAPLDVVVVRKIGAPSQPELALGAVGEGDVLVLDVDLARRVGVGPDALADTEERERAEVERRSQRLRGDHPACAMAGRTVVVVDDGIATGSTAKAACQVVRARGAARIVLAVPIAPSGWTSRMADAGDLLAALEAPQRLSSVGEWYADFGQTNDEQVRAVLAESRAASA